MTRPAPEPMPDDERSITVVHSPQTQFRRALLVMFVVLGLLLFSSWRQSQENGEKVEESDRRAELAVEQNERLQASLDELISELRRLEEESRIRSERTTAFIAAVLANSSDPVLREAARQALEDLEGTTGDPMLPPALDPDNEPSSAPAPGPSEPAAAPGPRPSSQPAPPPPAAPPSTEEPPPAPPEEEGPLAPVEDAVEAVDETLCAVLPTC